MRVNREAFLHCLESVQAGVTSKDVVAQASCFAVLNGDVLSYSDEVYCRAESLLPDKFSGAVPHKPLLELLRKLNEDEIEVKQSEGELLLIGKGRRAGIRMEREVSLPFGSVETPEEWRKLHPDFADAVGIVQCAASTDTNQFHLTCLHLHPQWIEACDSFQICRWPLKTGLKEPVLVRQTAIKHVVSLGMTEFAETGSWIHFRNEAKLVMACRRYQDEFPDITGFFEVKGTPTQLPKGLVQATENAHIFSAENPEADRVFLRLADGRLRIKGVGANGWYRETKKISYNGPPLDFRIAPQILVSLVKRFNDCVVAKDRLKVDMGSFVYVTCLGKPEGAEQAPAPQADAARSTKSKKRKGAEEGGER